MSELQPRPTFRSIRKWVSEKSGIAVELIEGGRRTAPIVTARWQSWWLARRLLGYEYTRIAKLHGSCDSTILMGIRSIEVQSNLEGLAAECASDLRIPMEEPKINI